METINQEQSKPLGAILVESASVFKDANTTTTSNPSEADVDGEGE
jgi:hypothetical protein